MTKPMTALHIMDLDVLECIDVLNKENLWPQLKLGYEDVVDEQTAYEAFILAHAVFRTLNFKVSFMTEEQAKLFWTEHVKDRQPFPFWLFVTPTWSC